MDGGTRSGGRGQRNHHGMARGRRGGARVQRVARARLHSYKARRRRGRGEDEDEENRPTKKRDSKSPEGQAGTRRGEINSGSAGGIVGGVSERRHRREVVGVRGGARTAVGVPAETRGELWLAVLARRGVAVEGVACERNIRRCDIRAREFGDHEHFVVCGCVSAPGEGYFVLGGYTYLRLWPHIVNCPRSARHRRSCRSPCHDAHSSRRRTEISPLLPKPTSREGTSCNPHQLLQA